MLLIFFNSLSLAMFDYSDRDSETTYNQVLGWTGQFFTWAFFIECVIKIWSFGFILHHNAYLKDGWNWLDFIVVIVGILENIPGIPSLKALRTLRVLRPLRSISSIPSLKRHINSLIASISPLTNVVFFLMFIFILFGILGVQNFKESLYWKCRIHPAPEMRAGELIWPVTE